MSAPIENVESAEPNAPAAALTELRTAPSGYRYVWPRPSPESQRSFYGETFYESEKPGYLEKMERELDFWDATWSLRRRLIEAALPAGERTLLDVGCSGGFLLRHFARQGWQVRGVEPGRRAAAHARDVYGLEVFHGPLEAFESDRRFAAVHSAQVLEHVLDPDAAMAKIAALVAPGGVAFIELPNDFNGLQRAARDVLGKERWWVVPRHHLNYFDATSLSRLMAEHGLEEIDRLASFPMELFLLLGEDYIGAPDVGARCHAKRMRFEKQLVAAGHADTLERLYRGLAHAGLGRTCGILARKKETQPAIARAR